MLEILFVLLLFEVGALRIFRFLLIIVRYVIKKKFFYQKQFKMLGCYIREINYTEYTHKLVVTFIRDKKYILA